MTNNFPTPTLTYVPDGSFLYCDKGVIPTPFRITEYAEVSLSDVPFASDENVKGIINVIPFGICAVKGGQPCMPATNNSRWNIVSRIVEIGSADAILDNSSLPCTQGGIIKIAPSFLHALTEMYDDPGEMFDKMVDMLKGTGENALAFGKGLVVGGLGGLLKFAWDVVKFPFAEGWTALTDYDQFKDNWSGRYNSAKDFGQAAWEKGEQLYGLATDPDARAAMWAYMSDPDVWEQAFDGVYSAVSEMDNTQIAEFGGQMAFEVLLGVFTGGMGASRHIAKTDDVFRAAQALENLDDFGDVGRALENLDDVIPEEILDDIDDVPGGQTILGQADELSNAQRQAIDEVENGNLDLDTNKKKGNYGEIKMDDHMMNEHGLEPINNNRVTSLDQKIEKGIDGVYRDADGNYVIVEAKYNTSKLSQTPADGPQMSDNWIEGSNRIERAVGDADLADDILLNGYDRVLTHIDPNGNVTTSRIDSNGKVVGSWP